MRTARAQWTVESRYNNFNLLNHKVSHNISQSSHQTYSFMEYLDDKYSTNPRSMFSKINTIYILSVLVWFRNLYRDHFACVFCRSYSIYSPFQSSSILYAAYSFLCILILAPQKERVRGENGQVSS